MSMEKPSTFTPPRCPSARPATFAQGFLASSRTVVVQRGCWFCECAPVSDCGPTPVPGSCNRPADRFRQTRDETCVQPRRCYQGPKRKLQRPSDRKSVVEGKRGEFG